MKTRTIYRTNSIALLAILLGLLGVINYFSYKAFGRFDMTEGKVYTISKSTRDILASLKDPVTITAYFSADLPAPLNNSAREVLDILEEYEVYSKGMVKLKRIDPAGDPELQQELMSRGISTVSFQIRATSEFAIKEGYISMELQYLDERKVFPNAIGIRDLEYTMTSTILKLTSGKTARIGFLSGQEEMSPYQELSQLRAAIEEQYEITTVDVSSGRHVPEDVDILMVVGPRSFTERDKYELDQYLMRGGKLVFLIDGVIVADQMFFAFPANDNLDDLLRHYGIKRNHDLVMDYLCERVSTSQGPWRLIQDYPLWVKVYIPNLKALGTAEDHPIINQLDSVSLPWVSSLEFVGNEDNIEVARLLRTTDESWVQTQSTQFKLNPKELPPPLPIDGMGEATRDLGLLLTGSFASFYKDKDIPAVEAAEGEEQEEIEEEKDRPERLDQSRETSILIVGNSRFVTNDYLRLGDSNGTFILNALDWMTLGGRLIGVRSRQSTDRPISRDTSGARIITAAVIGPFAVPFLIVVYGISHFILVRRRKRAYAQKIKSLGE